MTCTLIATTTGCEAYEDGKLMFANATLSIGPGMRVEMFDGNGFSVGVPTLPGNVILALPTWDEMESLLLHYS